MPFPVELEYINETEKELGGISGENLCMIQFYWLGFALVLIITFVLLIFFNGYFLNSKAKKENM